MTSIDETPETTTQATANAHRIRSYTLRQGRITEAQRRALENLWPIYGLEAGQALVPQSVFDREAPIIIEIGFGNGVSLARMAIESPDKDFVGIEVHRPGIGHLLLRLDEEEIPNVRVYCGDAVEILSEDIPDHSLDGINLFFPDPWPKIRHHKRRIVNADFTRLVARKLKQGGIFHAATDWEEYAHYMLEILGNCAELENPQIEGGFSPRSGNRPLTKFEARGERLGHGVWDMVFARR